MKKYLNLTADGWQYGSYQRKSYKTDMLYTFYQYREFLAVYNMSTGTLAISDQLAEKLVADGFTDEKTKAGYLRRAYAMFEQIDRFDEYSIEQIYGEVQQLRCTVFGIDALEKFQTYIAQNSVESMYADGIDQSAKKQQLLQQCDAVVFMLCQPEYYAVMERDLCAALSANKSVYLIVNELRGGDLPSSCLLASWLGNLSGIKLLEMQGESLAIDLSRIEDNAYLRWYIDTNKAVLMAYGEEALLHCRSLQLDSILHAAPSWYHTRALTNQFGRDASCIIYLPREYDLFRMVPLVECTRLTYWHLAQLWHQHGDEVYSLPFAQLYRRWPQMFLNIYANNPSMAEMAEDYPIQLLCPQNSQDELGEEQIFSAYDTQKNQAVGDYLNRVDGLEYHAAWFDEKMVQCDIPWLSVGQQRGILVHAVKVKKTSAARVVRCPEGSTLRRLSEEREPDTLKFYSNFLFFLTPKLAQQYNALRIDRPLEQIPVEKQHLDYALYYEQGKRVETFPLFRKACIAKKQDGGFLFFNYRLGGGTLQAGETTLHWTGAEVDPISIHSPVVIYTPYCTVKEPAKDINTIRQVVGENRVNLVVIQNRIVCIRRGSVILPSIGVVISLENGLGEQLIRQNDLKPLQDGYYECQTLSLSVTLDPPEQICDAEWKQVEWAYGGGLSLILNGKGLCDDGRMEDWLQREGWLSSLSCQTQESALHKMVRHPRTAIGVTQDGSLVVLVYSGRTRLSIGANYAEMVQIAKNLFPDVDSLMNVDGGGSAVLGVAINGSFMELSYPATSFGSCAGMVRPVNTALELTLKENLQ